MAFRLVAGLGNPGSEYSGTRHNIGFLITDILAEKAGEAFREEARGPARSVKCGEVRLLQPLTYMNTSGEAVRVWLDWLKLTARDLFVIVDDVTLPLGQLRLRVQGTHGGHNGLRSIEEKLGTTEYARLRCGVGPVPTAWSLENFVLGKFLSEEQETVKEMVKRAVAAFHCCQQEGISIAMHTFNSNKQTEENG